MPKIYVANSTTQRVELNYRLPTEVNPKTNRMMWSERLYVEKIPAGGQIVLSGGRDFSELEEKHIVEHQGNHYGARRDGENARGFIGLIFSDKPIKIDRIENAISQNKDAAEERSKEILGATAQSMLNDQIRRAQENNTALPQRVELEVAAEKSKDIDVAGRGAEATQEGIEPRNRGSRNRAA
jgi:hypothetical protein